MILYICYSLCLYIQCKHYIAICDARKVLLFIDRAGRKMCQDALCRPTSLAERSHADRLLFFLSSPCFSQLSFWTLFFFFLLLLRHLLARRVWQCERFAPMLEHPPVLGWTARELILIPSSALTRDSQNVSGMCFSRCKYSRIFPAQDSPGNVSQRTKYLRNTWNLILYY